MNFRNKFVKALLIIFTAYLPTKLSLSISFFPTVVHCRFMSAFTFAGNISLLAKIKGIKFLKSAESMLSLVWKARISQPDPSCLGKWSKQKEQNQIFVNTFDNDGFAHTDHKACNKICTLWKSVWNEQTLTPEVVAERLTSGLLHPRPVDHT